MTSDACLERGPSTPLSLSLFWLTMGKKKFAPEPKSKRDLGSGAKFLFFFWFTIDPEKLLFFFTPEPKSNKDLEKLRQKKNFAPEPKSKKNLGSGAKFLFFFLFTIV